jgi:outer membrane protein assembly factor BamB
MENTMSSTEQTKDSVTRPAEIQATIDVPGVSSIHGVSWDGHAVWFADGTRGGLTAIDPDSQEEVRRLPSVEADAGTAFDGTYLWQAAGERIQKIDPRTGSVLATIPAPDDDVSGLTWAEGALWAGAYRGRKIRKLDPATGEVLKTLSSDRLVTGVTWVDGELWHGTMEGGREDVNADLRRVDPESGEVLSRLRLPDGVAVSGVEADDRGRLWCADPFHGKLRAVRRR